MAIRTLAEIAARMRDIDIAILSTHAENGAIAGRPMSNNGQVEYDGTSCCFAHSDAASVGDIERNADVALGFQSRDGFYLAVEGAAEVVREQAAFAAHWTPELDRWFPDGADTEGMVMIRVTGTRLHYWDGPEDGEVTR